MSYATYTDFNARYATGISEAQINSHYLPFAAARLESLLGQGFTTPFSSNNLTARDLTLDLAYLMVLRRSKDNRDYETFAAGIAEQCRDLRNGVRPMITSSGESLFAVTVGDTVWSSTARYHTVFNLSAPATQEVDPQRLLDEEPA